MTDGIADPTGRPPMADRLPDSALEEINRLWTIVRAFSNTAHDVNNALQVIAGSAELLEGRELDPAVRRRVETIRTEAARAATTINRLLSYAQAEAATPQTVDVWPIVEAAVAMRVASANRHRIVLAIERAESRPCWVTVDAARTTQVLLDLLLAAEEVVARRRSARIVVGLSESGSEVRIAAVATCDEKPTPAASVEERVVLTSGAQLWAAAAIAAAQNGRVSVERTERGSVMTLVVPRVDRG